jgi:hypothetical protein
MQIEICFELLQKKKKTLVLRKFEMIYIHVAGIC